MHFGNVFVYALALLAIPAWAQTTPSAQDTELARAAKNPYDIARFVDSHMGFDWNVLWKGLGIEPLLIQPCGELTGGRRQCSTELITVLNPDQVILLLQGDLTPADIYLRFFQEKNGGWRFSGAHEAIIQQHSRRHEVDRSSGKPFLRVSGDGVHGSDIDSEVEEWFDLTQSSFDPVFSFVVKGHQQRLGFGISRRVFGDVTAENDVMSTSLFVTFFGVDGYGEHVLGHRDYTAIYSRTPGVKEFGFRSAKEGFRGPQTTQVEFESLVDLLDGPSNEDLIRYCMAGLKEVATGRDDIAKRWLKQFLTKARDTPEVRELKALLH